MEKEKQKIKFVETVHYINLCECGERVTMILFGGINYQGIKNGWTIDLGICPSCPTVFFTQPFKVEIAEKCHCSGRPEKEFCVVHRDDCKLNKK